MHEGYKESPCGLLEALSEFCRICVGFLSVFLCTMLNISGIQRARCSLSFCQFASSRGVSL